MSLLQDYKIARSFSKVSYRLYILIRLLIIRDFILDKISSQFPREGKVLDLGCGIGIFALKFAKRFKNLNIRGLDINAQRISEASSAARELQLNNISFGSEDLRKHEVKESFNAIYMIDLLHHLPKEMVPDFLRGLSENLQPGGRLLIKEIRSRPYLKVLFTRILDKIMAPQDNPYYWPEAEIVSLLKSIGFSVTVQEFSDFLPFPHVLYVAQRPNI